jgi:O-antigen/teichoic acid export membrane protein
VTSEIPEIPELPPPGRMAQLRGAARTGHSAMTVGLLVNGVASYVFLSAAGRALGPERFAPVSVLWAVIFLVGNGLYIPVELELGRSIAARRARDVGSGALVRRVTTAAAVLFALVAVVALAGASFFADTLFRGEESFVVALVVGIAGIAVMFVVRGLLAGSGRYYGYAVLFLGDALTKALPAVALAVAGVTEPLAYAAVVVAGAFVGAAIPMTRGTRLGEPGTPPPWRLLLTSLGFLLLTSFLSALTINIGTIAVEVLATEDQAAEAGVFLSGLVIARVPLFLFQAVQAIVLPRLSRLAAANDMVGFRHNIRLLLMGIGALTVVASLLSAAIGPALVQLLFGPDFSLLGARDMGLLTLASMLMMCALTVNQAQIALHRQHQTGWPWGVASLVFVAAAALSSKDLLLRVTVAMTAAGVVAVLIASLLLAAELRHPDEHREDTPAL